MKLSKGLNCGDKVETTKKFDEETGLHHNGTIDDVDSNDYNFIELLTDSGEMINLHISYVQKILP